MIELEDIEQALRDAAVAIAGAPACTGARLTRAVVDRSRRYTSNREELAGHRDADADLAARALFFTVADVDKIATPLAAMAAGKATGPLTILELGAGCGALSLGLLRDLSRDNTPLEVSFTLVDQDERALAIAERAIKAVASRSTLTVHVSTRVADLSDPAGLVPFANVDRVLVGSVLNELPPSARVPLMLRALSAVGAAGVVIVIEPALAASSRDLHGVRDALIASGAHVIAPCTHQNPCPMLQNDRDWCHEDRPVRLPERVRQLANVTGLRDAGLKFSYLVVSPVSAASSPSPLVSAFRVVGRPRHEKGRIEVLACGALGIVPMRLLRRHRSAHNRAIEDARRGDLLEVTLAPSQSDLDENSNVRVTHHR